MIGYEVLRERFQLDGYVHFDLRAFVPSIADVVERVASIGEDRWSFIVKNRDGEHVRSDGYRTRVRTPMWKRYRR